MLDKPDLFTAFSPLSLEELDRRIADLNAERKALSVMRRSLVARDKAKRRASKSAMPKEARHA